MTSGLWTVTASAAHAARWKILLRGAGAGVGARLNSISALAQAAGAGAEGLALVDAALLKGRAAEQVRSLREHCPRVQILVACDEAALEGPDLADALAAGALDYLRLARPDEALVEKIRAHIKRLHPRSLEMEKMRCGDIRVHWRRRAVEVKTEKTWKETAALTAREFELLRVFFEHAGLGLSREQLLVLVWKSRAAGVNPESLDKQVGALRRKLGAAGKRIETLRGFGYVLKP